MITTKLGVELPRQDPRILADAALKRERVRVLLDKQHLSGIVISSRRNFAWLTVGGDSRVVESTEAGFCSVLITRNRQYLFAHRMDAARLYDEQVPGQDYELISLCWHEGDPRERALKFVEGPIGSDLPMAGAADVTAELVDLHYPLTDLEIERTIALGCQVDEMMTSLARLLVPGMTEQGIAAALRIEHARRGIDPDVVIVGSDERNFAYRHPLPTDKAVRHYVLLHCASQKWGLHANLTRSVHFGPPDGELARLYDAAALIHSRILARLEPGLPFAEILANQKKWYAELGFPDEWHYHFQGGPTGYVVVDATRGLTDKVVQMNQPFEWFITITGTKVAELSVLTKEGVQVAAAGSWPTRTVDTGFGSVQAPAIMIL